MNKGHLAAAVQVTSHIVRQICVLNKQLTLKLQHLPVLFYFQVFLASQFLV